MIYKVKTSKKTENILNEIKSKFSITPNILLRISVGLSLKKSFFTKAEINEKYKNYDNQGLEFNRNVLIGENEFFYKVLMEEYCNSKLKDDEFFPCHFKFHLENGVSLLKSEIEISPTLEVFLKNLMNI